MASPLARATRMKSCPSTSSIDDRVMRTTTAESPSLSDSTGRNICWRFTHGSAHGGDVDQGRQPAEERRRADDEQDGDPEVRQGQPQDADDLDQRPDADAARDARRHSERDAHDGDGQDREQRELDRDRQPRGDQGRDRLAGAEGPPEVPLEHVAEPPEVLDGQRLVEAELLEHRRALRAAELAFRPRDDVDDVAGQEPDEQEDQDRDAEQGEDGPDRTPGEVAHPRAGRLGRRAAPDQPRGSPPGRGPTPARPS